MEERLTEIALAQKHHMRDSCRVDGLHYEPPHQRDEHSELAQEDVGEEDERPPVR